MHLLAKAVRIYRKKGASHLLRESCLYVVELLKRPIINPLVCFYYKKFKSGIFTFHGEIYNYFYHRYNTTWRNERAIEVPIVWDIVKSAKGKRILEIGNVLSHYFPVQHTILDKYEKAPGVINLDVVDFQPAEKYDLIVSISTLEHVGWDEEHVGWEDEHQERGKILRALENLTEMLCSEGQIVVTLPIGYNRELDKLLEKRKDIFTEQYCLKRISRDNRWLEVACDKIRHATCNFPFPSANAIIIGIIKKKKGKRRELICRKSSYPSRSPSKK